MASITMNPVNNQISSKGGDRLITINSEGNPSVITISQLVDKVDDGIVDRIDDEILEIVESQIEEMIDNKIENIDPDNSLIWNEVL